MTVHGLKYAISIHVLMQTLMLLSTYLYMKAREVYKIDSHSDLCFMCFGRKSVYIANMVLAFVIFIVMILFLVMFAQVALTVFASHLPVAEQGWFEWVLSQKATWVLFVVLPNMRILLAKNFADLTFQSKIMFIGIVSLLGVFIIKQFQPHPDHGPIIHNAPWNTENALNALNITMAVYSFMQSLFPIASQMKHSTTSNVMLSVFVSQVFCFTFYVTLTLLAMNLYGDRIDINLFSHLREDPGYLSLAVRLLFLMIFYFKVPFIFFPGKLSVFNMIAEYRTGGVSNQLN